MKKDDQNDSKSLSVSSGYALSNVKISSKDLETMDNKENKHKKSENHERKIEELTKELYSQKNYIRKLEADAEETKNEYHEMLSGYKYIKKRADYTITITINIIRQSIVTTFVLTVLILASFFDEQIVSFLVSKSPWITTERVSVCIGALALLIGTLQLIIAKRTLDQARGEE